MQRLIDHDREGEREVIRPREAQKQARIAAETVDEGTEPDLVQVREAIDEVIDTLDRDDDRR